MRYAFKAYLFLYLVLISARRTPEDFYSMHKQLSKKIIEDFA
jgi:hypothetical protein